MAESEFCITSAAFDVLNAKPSFLRSFWDASHIWGTLGCKVMRVKKYIWNLRQIQPQGYCKSDSLFPSGSFVHQDSEKYNISWHNTLSYTHPGGPSGHCLLGTLPCGFYLRSCNRSFPSPETQPDCSVAGGEVGEAGRDGKVVSLEEVRQDQVLQIGGSSCVAWFGIWPLKRWKTRTLIYIYSWQEDNTEDEILAKL